MRLAVLATLFFLSAPALRAACGDAVAVAGGEAHALVLKDDGSVWAFGSGAGRRGPNAAGGETIAASVPLPVGSRLIAASSFSAAVGTDDSLWIWSDASPVPRLVAAASPVRHLAASGDFVFVESAGVVRRVAEDGTTLAVASFPPGITAFDAGDAEAVALDASGVAWRARILDACAGSLLPAPEAASPVPGLPAIVDVAARGTATVVLDAGGGTWVWGCFEDLAADPTLTESSVPVPGAAAPGATRIVVADRAAIALDPGTSSLAWGSPWSAGKPYGVLAPASSPVPLDVANVVDLDGGAFTVALDASGEVWWWGPWPEAGTPEVVREPAEVPGLAGVVDVSSGWFHSLALTADGRAWAWGGQAGAMGLGSRWMSDVPRPIAGGPWAQVEAGGYVSVLRAQDGTAWAMGLGMDGTPDGWVDVPVQVPGLTGVVDVGAGRSHGAALLADGTVWTWGFGSLGLGPGVDFTAVPRQVPGLPPIVEVTAMETSAMALAADGTLWAWGENEGDRFCRWDRWTFDLAEQVPAGPFTAHSQGGFHSLALDAAGTIWSWGWFREGALGCGPVFCADAVPIALPAPASPSRIDAGFNDSYALFPDGSAWAWGWNEYGFAAPDLPDDRIFEPRPLLGLPPLAEVASGWTVTLARTMDGRVLAWGENEWGQTGRADGPVAISPRLADLGDALDGLGDSLRVDAVPGGALLTWGSRWGTSLHRVHRATRPDMSDETLLVETPGTSHLDPDPPSPLWFYRVAGVDCFGVEGP